MILRARLIRALLALGIPYVEALKMPLNLAYALLSDERLDNTHHEKIISKPQSRVPTVSSSSSSTTYISTQRKHSKPKA